MAFALEVDEGDEHEQAANKKSHMCVPSHRASTSITELSQNNVKAGAPMMAVSGTSATLKRRGSMSGYEPFSDISAWTVHVAESPKADIRVRLAQVCF